MEILEVLNVGQGDSIIIRPTVDCKYAGRDIFVDVGPNIDDVKNYIRSNYIHVFITHSHKDHLGGLKSFAKESNFIQELTLPYYHNEIILIAQSILKLKGINKVHSDIIDSLQQLIEQSTNLKQLSSKISFAYEGKYFCQHIKVLNPPVVPLCFDDLYQSPCEYYCKYLFDCICKYIECPCKNPCAPLYKIIHNLFEEEFANKLCDYIKSAHSREYYEDFPFFVINKDNDIDQKVASFKYLKASVVVNYILQNRETLEAFVKKPSKNILKDIYDLYGSTSHNFCTVLKLKYGKTSFLLASDASKRVFYRLMAKNESLLRAQYLKVPHHRSKDNVSNDILDTVNPRVAIISHNNKKFGRAKDSHPNYETLKLLRKRRIKILITNDVKKDKTILVMRKSKHSKDDLVKIH